MNFSEAPEFQKDVKSLSKKWRSIPTDIEAAKRYVLPLYVEMAADVLIEEYRRGFFTGKNATVLSAGEGYEVVKMRLDVADLGRNDKVRIIFIALKTESGIHFIELYSKSDKEREDSKRIQKYLP